MSSQLTPFQFQSFQVRVQADENGEPWFVAADVLAILELDRKALERLDDDERGVNSIHTLGGQQEMTTINESGLYSLILGSRKPEAKPFKKWVTSEVLPAIRKTGGYVATASYGGVGRPRLEEAELQMLFVGKACEILRCSDTSKIRLLANVAKNVGLPGNLLPEYADEQLTRALGDLLRESGSPLSAVKANPILMEMGYLEVLERRGSKGVMKQFKSITEAGGKYGKNETAPANPNETHPRWYVSKFPQLLAEMEAHIEGATAW